MSSIYPMNTQPFYSRLRVLRDEAAEEIRAKIRKLIKCHLTEGSEISKSKYYSYKAQEFFVEKVSKEFLNTEYEKLVNQANIIYTRYFGCEFQDELRHIMGVPGLFD